MMDNDDAKNVNVDTNRADKNGKGPQFRVSVNGHWFCVRASDESEAIWQAVSNYRAEFGETVARGHYDIWVFQGGSKPRSPSERHGPPIVTWYKPQSPSERRRPPIVTCDDEGGE